MRIAVLSDVHGNLPALDAVVADLATQGVDLTVDLGDLLSGGVQPRETADRLMELDWPTVRGTTSGRCSRSRVNAWAAPTGWRTTPSPTGTGSGWPGCRSRWSWATACSRSTAPPPTTCSTCCTPSTRPARARPPSRRWSTASGRTPTGRCCCAGTPTCSVRSGCRPAGWWSTRAASAGPPTTTTSRTRTSWKPAPRTPATPSSTTPPGSGRSISRAVTYHWELAARTAEGNDRPDVARALRTGRV